MGSMFSSTYATVSMFGVATTQVQLKPDPKRRTLNVSLLTPPLAPNSATVPAGVAIEVSSPDGWIRVGQLNQWNPNWIGTYDQWGIVLTGAVRFVGLTATFADVGFTSVYATQDEEVVSQHR